ncbi:MAG: hypothetical protein F4X97_11095 [Boseongicola sp. SB0662_bin_57]|nr:hypothetical protein [Boseongicola sp. SB0662_bin_57]
MQGGLRHFDSQTLDWLAVALRSGEHTRRALARELCERTGKLNALGRPCLSAPVKALPALAECIGIELLPARDVLELVAVPTGDVPGTRLACALEDLDLFSLDVASDALGPPRGPAARAAAHHLASGGGGGRRHARRDRAGLGRPDVEN